MFTVQIDETSFGEGSKKSGQIKTKVLLFKKILIVVKKKKMYFVV